VQLQSQRSLFAVGFPNGSLTSPAGRQ
jgi:hypothetical protein